MNVQVSTLDGVKVIVQNGKTVMTKEEVEERIANLTTVIETTLPARLAALDAQLLLENAQTQINNRLTTITETKAAFVAALAELNAS